MPILILIIQGCLSSQQICSNKTSKILILNQIIIWMFVCLIGLWNLCNWWSKISQNLRKSLFRILTGSRLFCREKREKALHTDRHNERQTYRLKQSFKYICYRTHTIWYHYRHTPFLMAEKKYTNIFFSWNELFPH